VLRPFTLLLAALVLPGALAAQTTRSLSPTLPSDTLEANYAPRSAPGPTPELAPTLPSDTLDATAPVDSFPTDPFDLQDDDDDATDTLPMTPGDSAALREIRSWIQSHPGLTSPPPVRAVLFRA
jgi:hypothetical protein